MLFPSKFGTLVLLSPGGGGWILIELHELRSPLDVTHLLSPLTTLDVTHLLSPLTKRN